MGRRAHSRQSVLMRDAGLASVKARGTGRSASCLTPSRFPVLRAAYAALGRGTGPVPAISVPEESAGAADADPAAGAARADAALAGRAVPTAALTATGKTKARPAKAGS